MTVESNRRTALVLGASMAGLVTARVHPYGYRGTDSRWRHYERLQRWPERYVVLGDAFWVRTAFNEVNQLVKPATSLFAPDIALRVLGWHPQQPQVPD